MTNSPITTPKRLVYNTVYNVIMLVLTALISFFLVRFFLVQLGEERYGIWVLIGSVFRYRGIMTMGLSSSINRHIPVYMAQGDNAGVQRVVSTTFFFFSVLAVLLFIVSVIICINIGSWFTINPDFVKIASLLTLMLGFCFAFSMPLQLFSGVLSGLQRYGLLNIASLVPILIQTALVIILMLHGYGLIMMGIVFGGSEILIGLIQFIFVKKLLPHISISIKDIDFGLLKEMLPYGLNTLLYATGAVIICKASELVIGVFLGTAEIAQYAVAVAGIMLLVQFLQAFTAAIKPAVSELDALDDHNKVREISFLTQKYSLLILIPAGSFFIIMGEDFIRLWVGDTFKNPSTVVMLGVVLKILTIGHCIRLSQHSNFLVLVGRGEHRLFGIFTAITALLCVVASVVAVKTFNLGLVGIAWANCIPMVLVSWTVLPIYFNRKLDITVLQSFHRVWWPAFCGGLPTIILIMAWKCISPPDSWLEMFLLVFTVMLVTLISGGCFSLGTEERRRFLRIALRN